MRQSLPGKLIRAIAAGRGLILVPLAPGWQRERKIIAATRQKTELLLTDPAALHLMACARAALRVPGDFAEAGVFKGGSARLICEEKGGRDLHLFDVFALLQDPDATGGEDVRAHFKSIHGSMDEVMRLLAPYSGVHLHPGIFPQTASGLEALRFCFVHLDLDLARPTLAALEYFHPRMSPGGIMVIDDYCETYVKAIVDDWFRRRVDTLVELAWSQLMVIRQSGGSAPDSE